MMQECVHHRENERTFQLRLTRLTDNSAPVCFVLRTCSKTRVNNSGERAVIPCKPKQTSDMGKVKRQYRCPIKKSRSTCDQHAGPVGHVTKPLPDLKLPHSHLLASTCRSGADSHAAQRASCFPHEQLSLVCRIQISAFSVHKNISLITRPMSSKAF
jgi:hypothetical protein